MPAVLVSFWPLTCHFRMPARCRRLLLRQGQARARWCGGRGLKDHFPAEALQAADVAVDEAPGVRVLFVVAGAEVAVLDCGVRGLGAVSRPSAGAVCRPLCVSASSPP